MSDETLELKLRALRELGFLDDDIAALFRKSPTVFNLSAKKIKEAIEVLMSTGKYDLSHIVSDPVSLTLSTEKRYKPRLQVLELLERKKLIQRWPCLSRLCRMADKQFHDKGDYEFIHATAKLCKSKLYEFCCKNKSEHNWSGFVKRRVCIINFCFESLVKKHLVLQQWSEITFMVDLSTEVIPYYLELQVLEGCTVDKPSCSNGARNKQMENLCVQRRTGVAEIWMPLLSPHTLVVRYGI